MTRRERAEARLEKRKEWAESRAKKSDAAANAATAISSMIPLGQPILVGHHSERHARRDRDRIHNNWAKSVEHDKMAKHHKEKAAGIAGQLETTIFSDDADAVQELEKRIAEKEAKRDQYKAINAAYKKRDRAALAELGLDLDRLDEQVKKQYSWERQPVASFTSSNLAASIRTDKKRLEVLKHAATWKKETQEAGRAVIKHQTHGYCSVLFPEKPERDIINALKHAGFRWNSAYSSWDGQTDAIPPTVLKLIETTGEPR